MTSKWFFASFMWHIILYGIAVLLCQNSLEHEMSTPSLLMVDLCKMDAPSNIHLALCTLHVFIDKNNRMPNNW